MSNIPTQFKPGKSGNPNGRPKRDWTWSGLLEEAMEETDETGEPYKKIIARKLRALGIKGDTTAIKDLMNRMDGMPQQSTDVTSKGEKILVVPPELIDKYGITSDTEDSR